MLFNFTTFNYNSALTQILIETMKDFQDFLNSSDSINPQVSIKTQKQGPSVSAVFFKDQITKALPYISPFLLSIVTGPFTTASILLQVTSKGIGSGLQAKIKAAPMLQRHISNGLFGDNRIYEVLSLKNYRQCFHKLGKEGIKGLYKGNMTGILLASSNAWLRKNLYVAAGDQGLLKGGLIANALTVTTCTLADLITLPLMTAQSRLILQNSSPNFRTYSSFLTVWRKAKLSLLFAGGSVLFLKNVLFDLAWVKLIPESPAYSFIISTVASHVVTYPFITIVRQLQVSEPNVPMMQNRVEKAFACGRRIWNQGGVTSFYRGFMAYALVHLFMGALMVQANLRSGYFYEQ